MKRPSHGVRNWVNVSFISAVVGWSMATAGNRAAPFTGTSAPAWAFTLVP